MISEPCNALGEHLSYDRVSLFSLVRLQVECPDELYDALVSTWDHNPQYVDVCDIIVNDLADDEDELEEEEEEDRQDPTLVHTFYRYMPRVVGSSGSGTIAAAAVQARLGRFVVAGVVVVVVVMAVLHNQRPNICGGQPSNMEGPTSSVR